MAGMLVPASCKLYVDHLQENFKWEKNMWWAMFTLRSSRQQKKKEKHAFFFFGLTS